MDSLSFIGLNGATPDVSVDKIICHIDYSSSPPSIGVFDTAGSYHLYPKNVISIREPQWLPSGQEIIFRATLEGGANRLRLIDLEGNQTAPNYGRAFHPDFLPDGKHLVYTETSGIGIADSQIWIMRADDGSEKRQITNWSRIRP